MLKNLFKKTKKYVAIDVGGTNIRGALIDENGKILSEIEHFKTEKTKELLLTQILIIIKQHTQKTNEAKIAIPGIIKEQKIVEIPNLNIKNWDLNKELDRHGIKTTIMNDLEAAWKAEEADTVIYVGTGIGSATNGKNTELGRTTKINLSTGKIKCYDTKFLNKIKLEKNEYLLEDMVSGKGISKTNKKHELYAKELAEKAKIQEKAQRELEEAGEYLGESLIEYDKKQKQPHKYVIGGTLGKNEHYFKGIQNKFPNIEKSKYNTSETIMKGLTKLPTS